MKKKLIVTAHDFGLCRSVNDGIEYVLNHKNNIITELSLLPNAPGSLEAIKVAEKYNYSLDLCLNLTTFSPLAKEVRSLTDDKGYFKKVDVMTWNFKILDCFEEKDVKKEIDSQWNWFMDNVGKKPSAILSRKNETGDPKILIPVVEKAKKENVPIRTPVWKWAENYGAQSYVIQEGVKTTGNIYVYPTWGKWGYDLTTELDDFIADVNKKPGVAELLIMMGFVDEQLFELSTLNWERGIFISLLEKNEIFTKIKRNFELINYSDL